MPKPPFSQLYSLTLDEIAAVQQDRQFENQGVQLVYAVDTSEIVEYCFPFDPTAMHELNIDQIADDQAALHELLVERVPSPLLIPVYEHELRRHLRYLSGKNRDIFTRAEILERFIRDATLTTYQSKTPEEMLANLKINLKEEFNILLSVALGWQSLALERFRFVVGHLDRVDTTRVTAIREANEEVTVSPLAEVIVRLLIGKLKRSTLSPYDKARKERSIRSDARAVDWLLQINRRWVFT